MYVTECSEITTSLIQRKYCCKKARGVFVQYRIVLLCAHPTTANLQ